MFFDKRKYNRGRLANEQIVLGGIDVESKNFFATIIPNRKKETIGYNIEKYVNEKSIYGNQPHTSITSLNLFTNQLNQMISPQKIKENKIELLIMIGWLKSLRKNRLDPKILIKI